MNRIRRDLVQELVSMARNWGLSEGSASIYTALALSGRALNMTELRELTGYSLSSVSTHLKSLADKYLVTRTKRGGVYVYKAEIHFEEIFRLLTKELLDRNILPLYRKVTEFKEMQQGALYQHLSDVENEMQKLIEYLNKIIELEGDNRVAEKNPISVPSMS